MKKIFNTPNSQTMRKTVFGLLVVMSAILTIAGTKKRHTAFADKLYAIRQTTAIADIDSFYQKFGTDSVFNENNEFITKTAAWWHNDANEPPSYFKKFIKRADGIFCNLEMVGGFKTMVIPIHADASANLVLTGHPNSEQPLANSLRTAVPVNTEGFSIVRLTAIVMANSASVNSPRIYFQYSTDGNTWVGNGAENISLSTTGGKMTNWVELPEGAIGDVWVRVVQNGGNGSANPALGTVTVQLR